MDLTTQMIRGALVPGVLAGAVALAGLLAGRRTSALAVAVGFAAAIFALFEYPSAERVLPRDVWQWLPWALLLAGLGHDLVPALRGPKGLLALAVVGGLLGWRTVDPLAERYLDTTGVLFWIGVFAVGIAGLGGALGLAAARTAAPWAAVSWIFVATGASFVLLQTGNARLAQMAGGLAAGSGALFGLGLVRGDTKLDGVGALLALGLVGLAFNAWLYGDEVPLFPFLLLLGSAVLPGAVALLVRKETSPPGGVWLLLHALPATAAAAVAWWLSTAGGDPYGYGY